VSNSLIPLVDPAQAPPAQLEMLQKVPPLAISRLYAHAPELAGPLIEFGKAVMSMNPLEPKLREAVTIRTGRWGGSAYVEEQHRRFAHMLEMDEITIDAAAEGNIAALPEEWHAIFAILEAGLRGRAADPADVSKANQAIGHEGIVAMLATAGLFSAFAILTSSLGLLPES
jgi:alkylhydroperoxidase family enzyme